MKLTRSAFLRISVAAAAMVATSFSGFATAQAEELVFATEGAYPPFNQTSPSGDIVGYEPDILAEVAKRAGFEYKLVPQAWDGMIQGLADGKYNAVIDAVTVTEKRQKVVDFSLPYTSGGSLFVSLKENGVTLPGTDTAVSLDDEAAAKKAIDAVAEMLKGKIVGVQIATIQADFLNKYIAPAGVTLRTYQSGPDAYQDLLNGRTDFVMSSDTNLSPFLKKHGEVAATSGPNFSGGVMGAGAGIAVQKGDDALRKKLDDALTKMSRDGTLSKLSKKWFDIDITPKL